MTIAARYTRTAMTLHWVVALLMIVNVGLAWVWPYAADESVRPLINNHKAIGVTVLGLVLLRILWRIGHRPPPMSPDYARWERSLAHVVHVGLYVVMLGMPLTGWIMDSAWEHAAENPMPYFGLFEWPRLSFVMALDPATKKTVHDGFGEAHEILAKFLYLLFALHLAGALKHQFQGHREIQRMLPWGRAPKG